MTAQERSDAPDSADAGDAIVTLAVQCQQRYIAWFSAGDPALQAALGAEYRSSLEQLWLVLADDLRRVARGWMYSNMAPDLESLALNLFANVVVGLPKLQIDPTRNARNLLITVARRGQIDDYRRSYGSMPRPPQPARGQAASDERQTPGGHIRLDTHADVIDPRSANVEERMVEQLDQQAILQTVWDDYWPHILSPPDFLIMELRWRFDPPYSFRDIAARLGAGWEADAVRQRHHRIMNATRRYLYERGLIDEHAPF